MRNHEPCAKALGNYIYIYTVGRVLKASYIKCLRLRENKLIAFPIIAIADDLQFEPHTRIRCTYVVLGSNNFLRSNSQLLYSRSQTFPVLRMVLDIRISADASRRIKIKTAGVKL